MKNYGEQAENILRRQFTPSVVWTSDITFIRIAKGQFYLCVIIDLFVCY